MAKRKFRVWRGDKAGGDFKEFDTAVDPGMVVDPLGDAILDLVVVTIVAHWNQGFWAGGGKVGWEFPVPLAAGALAIALAAAASAQQYQVVDHDVGAAGPRRSTSSRSDARRGRRARWLRSRAASEPRSRRSR